MNNLITEKMLESASDVSNLLISASVSYKMDGLGGSLTWEEFTKKYGCHKFFPLIHSYVRDEITANAVIFLVMYSEMQ